MKIKFNFELFQPNTGKGFVLIRFLKDDGSAINANLKVLSSVSNAGEPSKISFANAVDGGRLNYSLEGNGATQRDIDVTFNVPDLTNGDFIRIISDSDPKGFRAVKISSPEFEVPQPHSLEVAAGDFNVEICGIS